MLTRVQPAVLAFVLLAGLACESAAPTPPPESPAPAPPPLDVFSPDRAWSDLMALTAGAGSDGLDAARTHLLVELRALGVEVQEVETPDPDAEVREVETPDPDAEFPTPPGEAEAEQAPPGLRHVVATLPGRSPGRFVLLAPFDGALGQPPPLGGNAGASGAALLLELARVLSTRELAYTTQLVFLEGEGDPDLPPPHWRGSRGLAAHMAEAGELDGIRVLVAFDQVCDADLVIARDIASHRMYREEFFKAARRIRRQDAFPAGQPFERVRASHEAFLDRGVRGSVAIADTHLAEASEGEGPAGRCAAESLEAVGLTTLEALHTIAARLEKIDRFSRSPLDEIPPSASAALEGAPPPSPEAAASATDAAPSADPLAAAPSGPTGLEAGPAADEPTSDDEPAAAPAPAGDGGMR